MQCNRYRVLVATPQGLESSALVIAADRAGGLGILDGTGQEIRDRAIRRIRDFRVRSYAVRVHPEQVWQKWLDRAGENLVAVVCTSSGTRGQLTHACAKIQAIGRRALCEITSLAEAETALDAGSDGLIAVGHEAGGQVGADSAFILLQAILARTDRPVWIRGGIGPRVSAGCIAVGAAGVVLEGAVLLARESSLAEEARRLLGGWDGSEPMLIEPAEGPRGPCLRPAHVPCPGPDCARRQGKEARCGPGRSTRKWAGGRDRRGPSGRMPRWPRTWPTSTCRSGASCRPSSAPWTVELVDASKARPLAEDAPLARAHGCRLPILQGPMTRVSDVAPFAEAVAREGGLPFIALALLRRPGGRGSARGDRPSGRGTSLGRGLARLRPGRACARSNWPRSERPGRRSP